MLTKKLTYRLALILGLFSVIISITDFSYLEGYFKTFFHAIVLIAYSCFAKKIKPLFYVFYIGAMAVEFMDSSKTYFFNFFWILLGYTVCFVSGIILLLPLLKKGKLKLKGINLLIFLVVATALTYIIFSLYMLFINELSLNSYMFFTITVLLFTFFIFCCFYITSINNHPKVILLFLTGIGYLLTCTSGLIVYLFQEKNVVLALTVNFSESLVQYCFGFFMLNFQTIIDNDDIIELEN
ncbi:hypothetical protein [Lacinutrix sp. MedPE-SW]|uniref:hypothetical protein n=1 Tax=Lacinutrix sp. MedPE-SW TaxID=1860087 RepID=UPI0009104B4F|nr:hypothetical protein [Lacinutrix sp. MedPE-SW]OIQ23414.1 MAG: hypothetical protein BM549_02275 [Lacinutrix sp. MedPE-SW]